MSPLHSKLVLGGAMLGLLSAVAGLERCPELVGFSRTTPATAAANRPRAVVRGFDVDQVVFRPDSAQKRMWHQPTARDMAAMNGAPKSAPAYRHPTRSDVAAKAGSPSRSATRFVQVTVVTSWERPDGSALVLTSVRSSTQARAQSATTYITDHPSQEIYPYAAIPVRDGWLVFQL